MLCFCCSAIGLTLLSCCWYESSSCSALCRQTRSSSASRELARSASFSRTACNTNTDMLHVSRIEHRPCSRRRSGLSSLTAPSPCWCAGLAWLSPSSLAPSDSRPESSVTVSLSVSVHTSRVPLVPLHTELCNQGPVAERG